jgi:hypothetical protein
MVESITGVQSPINFLLNQVSFVIVVPKYLSCAIFSNRYLSLYDFALHFGDETATCT